MPQFSPDGVSLGYAYDDQGFYLIDLDTEKVRELYAVDEYPEDLQWAPSGDLLMMDDEEPLRLRPAGIFASPRQELAVGDNRFTAHAEDAQGYMSELSEEMVVTLLVDDRPDLAISPRTWSCFPRPRFPVR